MAEMISAYNLLLRDRDQLREALKRLHDWTLAQPGDFMCAADHPIAQAAAVLSSSLDWSRTDALLAECKETVAKFDAAKLRTVDVAQGDKNYRVHYSGTEVTAIEASFYGYRGRLTYREVKKGGAAWRKVVAAAREPQACGWPACGCAGTKSEWCAAAGAPVGRALEP
jgi:hypothetical protein